MWKMCAACSSSPHSGAATTTSASAKRPRSAMWDHFLIDDSQPEMAVCSHCQHKVKHSQNTSDMFKHLKIKHPDIYKEVDQERTELEQRKKACTHKQLSLESSLLKGTPYPGNSQRRKLIDDSLTTMIVIDLQPSSIVNDEGFIDFVRVLDPRYTLPSRRSVMRSLLPEKYESVKAKILSSLSDTKYVALTTDLWTSCQTEGFLTLTCHYINRYWELCSYVLATVEFSNAHTAEHIAEEVKRLVDMWAIKDKVVCLTVRLTVWQLLGY